MVRFGKKLTAGQVPKWRGYDSGFFSTLYWPVSLSSPNILSTASDETYLDFLPCLLNKKIKKHCNNWTLQLSAHLIGVKNCTLGLGYQFFNVALLIQCSRLLYKLQADEEESKTIWAAAPTRRERPLSCSQGFLKDAWWSGNAKRWISANSLLHSPWSEFNLQTLAFVWCG